MIDFPAIYEMEPIGVDGALEASGVVYRFCSEACRDAFDDFREPVAREVDNELNMLPGTVCDHCGEVLIPEA